MRGQITVFLILGLVIFASFALIFYVSAVHSKAKLQKGAEYAVRGTLADPAIDAYVEQCLKRTVEKGLKLLGLQGGNLYAPPLQNGTVIPASATAAQVWGKWIDYGIIFPAQMVGYPEPPVYPMANVPFGSAPLEAGQERLGLAWGYFGQKHLPPLCEEGGANDILETEQTGQFKPCDKGFYGKNSIQWQLEKFVQEELPGCIDAEQIGRGFQSRLGKPNVTIILGETNIFVNSSYPVTITERGNRNTRVSFQTFVEVRLRKVYQYLDSLLLLDTYYLGYLVLGHNQQNRFWDENFRVERVCPNCNADHTDIVTIIDQASLVNVSEPFVFRTAVQNRRPALNFLHQPSALAERGVNYIVPAGQTITLEPEAMDPDEDELRYTYSGWKEDATDQLTGLFSCCLQNLDTYADCSTNLLKNCLTQSSTGPREWSSSPLYQSTGKDASVTTSTADVGLHTVRVTVQDEAGLLDYQDIGIFVAPEGAVGSFTCSSTPEEPLRCSCTTGPCAGKDFADLAGTDASAKCVGFALCDTSCTTIGPEQSEAACVACRGGKFTQNPSKTKSACCLQTQCGYFGGAMPACLSNGDAIGATLCKDGASIDCDLNKRYCRIGQQYCDLDASDRPLWKPLSAAPTGISLTNC